MSELALIFIGVATIANSVSIIFLARAVGGRR